MTQARTWRLADVVGSEGSVRWTNPDSQSASPRAACGAKTTVSMGVAPNYCMVRLNQVNEYQEVRSLCTGPVDR